MIDTGDKVFLTLLSEPNDSFPAIVLNRPRGEGDMWDFQIDGNEWSVNPYALQKIVKDNEMWERLEAYKKEQK